MDFKAEAKKMAADKLKSYGGESKGGWGKSLDAPSVKTPSRKGYALGGPVEGRSSPPRMDRPAGGGKKGAGTVVNIIVGKDENNPAQGAMPPPMPMAPPRPPMPPAPPMAGPPGMPPGGPPMGPGGPPPGMMGKPPMMPPPGMPPMGHASGGRVGYKDGGNVSKEIADVKKSLPKAGGPKATSTSPKIEGGACGGLGRLEKVKDYGSRSS
jgi:hypothetical protein